MEPAHACGAGEHLVRGSLVWHWPIVNLHCLLMEYTVKRTERRIRIGGRVSVPVRGLAVWFLLLVIVLASTLDLVLDGPSASWPNTQGHTPDLRFVPGLILTPLAISPATTTACILDAKAFGPLWPPSHRADHPPRTA
jgi:hypothetical protein